MPKKQTATPCYNLYRRMRDGSKQGHSWISEAESDDITDIDFALVELIEDLEGLKGEDLRVVKVCDSGVYELPLKITPPVHIKAKVELEDVTDET